MIRFVLDCSVSAAWCLKDESTEGAERSLRLLATGEALVPALWVVEMANVLLVAERRGRITARDAASALELLEQLPILVHNGTMESMLRIRTLAAKHGLTAYDACYLDLALQNHLPLASLDQTLRDAAKAASVRLV